MQKLYNKSGKNNVCEMKWQGVAVEDDIGEPEGMPDVERARCLSTPGRKCQTDLVSKQCGWHLEKEDCFVSVSRVLSFRTSTRKARLP